MKKILHLNKLGYLIELEMTIKKNNLKIKYIVNTHHHFDHTLGNDAMVELTKAPIIQHESSELKHDVAVKDVQVGINGLNR